MRPVLGSFLERTIDNMPKQLDRIFVGDGEYVRDDEAIATISDLKRRPSIAKDQRNTYQKRATMKRKEFELLIELALAVRDMAPPETQRAIDRRINNLENEADNEPNDTKAASEGATTQS